MANARPRNVIIQATLNCKFDNPTEFPPELNRITGFYYVPGM